MNCRTCHFELSQCLDGRLPSGRRTAVMAHVDSCDDCASFWAELQRAQELVLQLPQQRVRSGFREQLFDRIRSGEGTPAAVFQEAVPLLSKIRYALSGAAAAAAVVLAIALLRRDAGGTADLRDPDTMATAGGAPTAAASTAATPDALLVSAAGSEAAPHENPPRQLMPRQAQPAGAQPGDLVGRMITAFRPLTSDLLAVEAAKYFERRFEWTNHNLSRLQQGVSEFAVREVCDNAVELKQLGELLLDMRRDRRLSFDDSATEVELGILVRMLDERRLRNRSLETVEVVIAPALRNTGRLADISRELKVRPLADGDDPQPLLRLIHGRQDLLDRLFVPLPGDRMPFPQVSQLQAGGPFLLFRDDCGVRFVAPRSQIEVILHHGR